jgi:hypothetical protein
MVAAVHEKSQNGEKRSLEGGREGEREGRKAPVGKQNQTYL